LEDEEECSISSEEEEKETVSPPIEEVKEVEVSGPSLRRWPIKAAVKSMVVPFLPLLPHPHQRLSVVNRKVGTSSSSVGTTFAKWWCNGCGKVQRSQGVCLEHQDGREAPAVPWRKG
jgi:hypothetical protein